jgi:hypothetical protein
MGHGAMRKSFEILPNGVIIVRGVTQEEITRVLTRYLPFNKDKTAFISDILIYAEPPSKTQQFISWIMSARLPVGIKR